LTLSQSHGNSCQDYRLGIMLVLVLFVSGCTQQAPTPVPTTAPTQATTVIPTLTSNTCRYFFDSGTNPDLERRMVYRDPGRKQRICPGPEDSHHCAGGNGSTLSSRLMSELQGSDGIIENGIIPKPLKVGDFVALNEPIK